MNKSASVKTLCQIKDIGEQEAKIIRALWLAVGSSEFESVCRANGLGAFIDSWTIGHQGFSYTLRDCMMIRPAYHNWLREFKKEAINHIMHTYGVEYLGVNKRTNESVYYCNAGDTYATTILFFGSRLVVGNWGALVESGKIKEA